MTRALAWLETVTEKKTILTVAEGNEGVFAFTGGIIFTRGLPCCCTGRSLRQQAEQ